MEESMDNFPHLTNAPITEAIIEFGVVPRPGTTIPDLESIKTQLEARYGQCHPLYNMKGQVTIDAKTGNTKEKIEDSWQVGYKTVAGSDGRLATVTLYSASFHKLKPYTSWEDVFSEAWGLWEVYCAQFEPESVRRLAARYINRLELPTPNTREEYLKSPAPAPLDYTLAGYVKKVTVQEKASKLWANVIEALEVPQTESVSRVVIILDNDVYSTRGLDPSDESGIRRIFADIQRLKNKVFYDAVTDRVVEEYK